MPPPSVAPPASAAPAPSATDAGFFVGTDATAIQIDALQGDMGSAALGGAAGSRGVAAGASAVSGMSTFAQQQVNAARCD